MLKKTDNGHLSLIFDHGNFKPFSIDFTSNTYKQRFKTLGRKQPLARAIGVTQDCTPTVIDATAGLATDAVMMAALGCQVSMIEQSPLIAQLLQDGLARAHQHPLTQDIVARMQLHIGNACELIPTLAQHDVIYIDPMFPATHKSAKVKKNMQILQAVVGHQSEAALLAVARAYARQRVVLKRPRQLQQLPPKDCQVIKTKTTQFWLFPQQQPPA